MPPVLDLSGFPIVRVDVSRRSAGGNARFMAEMDALFDAGQPFVVLSDGAEPQETPAEAQARGRWYRERHAAFAATCRGMGLIEPDPERRAMLAAQVAKLARAFPVPLGVFADDEEARRWAEERLR